VARPSQRRALGALFFLLTVLMAGIAWAAYRAEQWVILIAAGVIAAWLASLVLRAWGSSRA
jgi:membrane associated rhomboid family serine protease